MVVRVCPLCRAGLGLREGEGGGGPPGERAIREWLVGAAGRGRAGEREGGGCWLLGLSETFRRREFKFEEGRSYERRVVRESPFREKKRQSQVELSEEKKGRRWAQTRLKRSSLSHGIATLFLLKNYSTRLQG